MARPRDNRDELRAKFYASDVITVIEYVIAFLLESGMVLCLLWILDLAFKFVPITFGTLGMVWSPISATISGMHPALVVVIVHSDRTLGATAPPTSMTNTHNEREVRMMGPIISFTDGHNMHIEDQSPKRKVDFVFNQSFMNIV
ncbi:hypothetical protein EIP86_003466 [Pleurotus ostreatoroseus]|nr:hypothetical protein EIP86_003466 [Pleurotus ostreatoroseus]